jgi:hypothetical protein
MLKQAKKLDAQVTSSVNSTTIKIYINGWLHFCIRHTKLLGFQSWIKADVNPRYFVEYYLSERSILTEYDTVEKWKSVLKILDGFYC